MAMFKVRVVARVSRDYGTFEIEAGSEQIARLRAKALLGRHGPSLQAVETLEDLSIWVAPSPGQPSSPAIHLSIPGQCRG